MIDVKSKLAQTKGNLQELGNAVSSLVNFSPEIFEDPKINSLINEFRRVYHEAIQKIENPKFCIATIGTTSSGKSTIVNALIGRKIAPMEAGEMSGGVLTLNHSEEHKLSVNTTEEGVWDAGEWAGLDDEDCYLRISGLMHRYHEHRKKKDCAAPDVTAFIPLLPVGNPRLLSLPMGVGVEFLDLPGLKSVVDRANLAVIQKKVNTAFSLVALDYTQVDDTQRQKLLEELKGVVKNLGGGTDSMIFILNKVNLRKQFDLPLSERLDKLKKEIQEVLSLSEPPDILPFNSLILFYAQCAWGTGPVSEASTVKQDTRLKFIKAMIADCAVEIKLKTKENKDLKNWFRDIEDKIEEEDNHIDDETMRQILAYALEWSGGDELWSCLNGRVRESFSELVLLPALNELFNTYDNLDKSLDLILQARKIYNQEDVEKERERIAKLRQSLKKNTGKICQDYQKEIKQIMDALKTDDLNVRSQVIQEAEKKGRKGFQVIFDTVNEVEGEVTQLLVAPVRDALKNNQGSFDLKEKLEEVISPPLAENIAREYDNVSRRLKNFTAHSKTLVKRVREDDKTAIMELKHDERYVRLLYQTMRDALSARAEFCLQSNTKEFITALESLVDEQISRLKYSLSEKELSSLDIEQAVISDLRKKLSENLPALPEKFFEIPAEGVGTKEIEETEKIGEEQVRKSREVGSCLDKKTEYYSETKDKMGQVQYKELILPDTDTMAKQWIGGIQKGRENLWNVLCDWITQRLTDSGEMFEDSVQEIMNLAERSLKQQLEILERREEDIKHWQSFELQKNATIKVYQKLEQEIRQ